MCSILHGVYQIGDTHYPHPNAAQEATVLPEYADGLYSARYLPQLPRAVPAELFPAGQSPVYVIARDSSFPGVELRTSLIRIC